MGNTIGRLFRITTWGETRGKGGIGCVVDGCPSNMQLSEKDIQKQVDRRRPGQSKVTTQRKESDKVEILSGVFNEKTTGAPIGLRIDNANKICDKDYERFKVEPRPGHADYAYSQKYMIWDYRHGGRSSGRETAARVAGGAIARKVLSHIGVKIVAYSTKIGKITAEKKEEIDANNIEDIRERIESNTVRCIDLNKANEMEEAILAIQEKGDSLGGIIEVVAVNVPVGLGEPVFDKLNADLGKAMLSIPAVAAVGVGDGFRIAEMKGSEYVDDLIVKDNKIQTSGNKAGGIKGGISIGMPIKLEIAVKPPTSIQVKKNTVNLITRKPVSTSVKGQHDPCIVPRIIPVAEAMLALVLADHGLISGRIQRVFE